MVDKYTVMRKLSALFVSASILLGFGLFFTACDDDEPPVKPNLSFAISTLTANESDENLEIQVVLDNPAPEDITIDYSLGGTAVEYVNSSNSNPPDYELIADNYGEVEIKKGETTGIIELDLYSDGTLEVTDETIEISIDDVDSEQIEITRDDEITITLKQEDGLIIILEWPAPSASGQADMDIILRFGQNTTTWDGILGGAAEGSVEVPEILFVPKVVTYPAYGVSYVYYDGTLDPLQFTATFIDFANGAAEAVGTREPFTATYTAANKNKWTDVATTKVVQTFLKTGGAFSSPTAISVPVSGSRIGSSDNFVSLFNKNSSKIEWATQFQKLLKK